MKSTSGMARFLIILAAMVFVVGLMQVAYAQRQGGMRMSPAQRAEQLGKQLSLDSVTVAKIAVIYDNSQKEMTAKRDSLQGDMDGMRAAMQEIRAKVNKEVEALLTPEQLKKYQGILKEQQDRMQQRQRNN
jgi:protein CpxP